MLLSYCHPGWSLQMIETHTSGSNRSRSPWHDEVISTRQCKHTHLFTAVGEGALVCVRVVTVHCVLAWNTQYQHLILIQIFRHKV